MRKATGNRGSYSKGGFANFSAGYAGDMPHLTRISYEQFLSIQLVPELRATPYQRLALEVLTQGLDSLASYRGRESVHDRRIYSEEYAWLTDENPRHLFSFLNLCEVFGFDAARILRAVLATSTEENSGTHNSP